MDWLTFFSKLIDSLAWPVVAMLIVASLKDVLPSIFPLLKKFKAANFEIEFREAILEVKKSLPEPAASAQQPPGKTTPVGKSLEIKFDIEAEKKPADVIDSEAAQFFRLADLAPRAAIVEAWQRVEDSARRLVERAKAHMSGTFDPEKMTLQQALKATKLLTEDQIATFAKMRALRSRMLHAINPEISMENTIAYIDASYRLRILFDSLVDVAEAAHARSTELAGATSNTDSKK